MTTCVSDSLEYIGLTPTMCIQGYTAISNPHVQVGGSVGGTLPKHQNTELLRLWEGVPREARGKTFYVGRIPHPKRCTYSPEGSSCAGCTPGGGSPSPKNEMLYYVRGENPGGARNIKT